VFLQISEGDVIPSGMLGLRRQFTRRRLRSAGPATIAKFARNDSGVTAIEYAFIAGLVAIAIVAIVTTLGTSVSGLLFGPVLSGF
jgi:pilus assembly protein Flp/PilA